jgi:hypothetical protein
MEKKTTVALIGAFLAAGAFWACGAGEGYGEAVGGKADAAPAELLSRGEAAAGEEVTVEGKVTAVCPTGCWLDLADDAGVSLHVVVGGDFAVPQSLQGKRVRAAGTVRFAESRGQVELVARGIKVL